MQPHATGSHYVATEENSFYTSSTSLVYSDSDQRQNQNHFVTGFSAPSTLKEAMNSNLYCGQLEHRFAIADSDEFCTLPTDRYTSLIIQNQGKPTMNSSPFAYPLDTARNSSNINVDSSFGFVNFGHENSAFDTSRAKIWDFSNFATRPDQLIENCVPNEWMMTGEVGLNSKELSLSLTTSQPSIQEMSSSGVTGSYSLQNRQLVSEHMTSCSSGNNLSAGSYKHAQPPSLLSESRFVHAMQEILAEIACYALEYSGPVNYSHVKGTDDGTNVASFSSTCIEAKKKHLLDLLQAVDERYNQCSDEIHTVTSAFHAVTELDPHLHARFALPTISFMYKSMRERISTHILAMGLNPSHHERETREDNNKSIETCFVQKQWALQQLSKRDHQFWRPQRGLPERSVSVLRAWMFQNFLHPYPKDSEKHLLALRSGLTRNQVSNWFINARVRLWKPMIEEMYAEMNKRKAPQKDETEGNLRNQMHFESRRYIID